MLPCTLSASLGFMMPSGTAPNAIVFSTGHLTVRYMARVGFALNLLSIVVVTARDVPAGGPRIRYLVALAAGVGASLRHGR